jgi:hypothetical protein
MNTRQVKAYLDDKALPDFEGLTFDDTYMKEMRYDKFIKHMTQHPVGSAMYYSTDNTKDTLMQSVVKPEFYDSLA